MIDKSLHGACAVLFICALFGSGVVVPAAGGEGEQDRKAPLTMHSAQAFAMEPAVFNTVVYVAPHEENRLLRIVVESDGFYTSSDIQLDGLAAPLTHPYRVKWLPAGDYCVEATLFRGTQQVNSVRRAYRVLGADDPLEELRFVRERVSSCGTPASDASVSALESATMRPAR